MNTPERKKFPLPESVKWLPGKSLLQMPKVLELLPLQKIPRTGLVAPQYLLPPKITKSKKPCFM